MKLLMANQRKGTLEQQMQSFEIIREKKDMLKLNQKRKDARYQALTKQLDDLEMKFTTLQQDKDGIQGQVQVQEIEILKLKGDSITVHQRDHEAV